MTPDEDVPAEFHAAAASFVQAAVARGTAAAAAAATAATAANDATPAPPRSGRRCFPT